jgi:hypothetical protein
VPLTLYNNGLSMFAGPFRPYSDPSSQQLIKDLTDGYFPSELQHHYPHGVPLLISDQRDTIFRQRTVLGHFPGSGNQLGGDKGPSRLLPAGSELRTSPKPRGLRETSQLVGQRQLSLDQFLAKLPQSVVKGGRVLDIRAGIRETLGQVYLILEDCVSTLDSRLLVLFGLPSPRLSKYRAGTEGAIGGQGGGHPPPPPPPPPPTNPPPDHIVCSYQPH